MNRYRIAPILFVAFVLALPGAAKAGLESTVDPSITDGTAAKQLSAAEAKWAASGVVNYRFQIDISCFCPNTEPTEVLVMDGTSTVSGPDWSGPKSVPEIFAVIAAAIDRKSAELNVKYRDEDGVPVEVWVDRNSHMVDEEFGYTVTGFVDVGRTPTTPVGPTPTGGASTKKQAARMTRNRIKRSSLGRSWTKGHHRSVKCHAAPAVYVCKAKWTYKGTRRSDRILVRRVTA